MRPFSLDRYSFLLYALDVCLVAVAGYWINDWCDRSVDAINRPDRLLVKLNLGPAKFWSLLLGLVFLGLALTFELGVNTDNSDKIWLYPAAIVLLLIYALYFNRLGLPGNLLVSFMVALLPGLALITEWNTIGQQEILSTPQVRLTLLILGQFSLLLFFTNFARELIKDIEDLDGDKLVQSKSIANRFGQQKAKRIAAIALLLAIAGEVWFLLSEVSEVSWALALLISLLLLTAILLVLRANNRIQFSRISVFILLIMTIGMAQMATVFA